MVRGEYLVSRLRVVEHALTEMLEQFTRLLNGAGECFGVVWVQRSALVEVGARDCAPIQLPLPVQYETQPPQLWELCEEFLREG